MAAHDVLHDNLGLLGDRIATALSALDAENVIERVRRHDYTLWGDDPTEITQPNRLGWLEVHREMLGATAGLVDFAASVTAEGYTTAVLMGMGGSSLAPEVFQESFGTAQGMLSLNVLDTTHPEAILELQNRIDLRRTLFIVSSKSGSTIETMSQFAYFWGLHPDGAHYIAITDEGSDLHRLGEERGFRRVFLNNPNIGGRYSALSYFGLVPAALMGVDLDTLLARASEMGQACLDASSANNPGAYLGAVMGEAALAGRDKLTLFLPDEISSFGDWVEQLIAESTGKLGKGIVPIVGEPMAPAGTYGDDRLFVAIGEHTGLQDLEAVGHPVVRLPYDGLSQLGAEFYRWELATAIAGQRLGINPFDQPNVQSAKDATGRILESGALEAGSTPDLGDVLATLKPGDYAAILAYLPRSFVMQRELQALRLDIHDKYSVATSLGFGPRYLHSTGQLHKGGANSGVFILITDDAATDVSIPGKPFGFGRLIGAQAIGDLQSLQAMGRRVCHIHLSGENVSAIQALRKGTK